MSRIFLFLLLSSFLQDIIFPQDLQIKTLRAYLGSDEREFPVLLFSKAGRMEKPPLTIDFDLQAEFLPSFNIVFRYCDKNWIPSDNIFFRNEGKNTAYFIDFITLPSTVEDARYHFRKSFPNSDDEVEFPFSGKWMFFITESSDTSVVYGSGRFYVVHEEIPLSASIKKDQLEEKTYFPADLAKVFNITASFSLPEEFFPSFVDFIEIVENQKSLYPVWIDRSFNTGTRQFYWDAARKFSFTARDIFPGNEYRQADLRDINKFNKRNVKAQFDGIEYSRFFREAPDDLDGASVIPLFRDKAGRDLDEHATYLDVTFSIRPPEESSRRIFLTGAFNNWQVLPGYELTNENGLYSKTIQLKRGIYDYQYVAADIVNNEIRNEDWLYLEGNNWETGNQYHIFLYYKDPDFGGYDRIIGYIKLISPGI